MDYKIEKKEAFTVVGSARQFNSDSSYSEVPKFWCEHFEKGNGKYVCGMFGISFDCDGKVFNYMIADSAEGKGEMPADFITKEIPAKTWAIFPIKGAIPNALQEANSKIWNEWLPNNGEYEMEENISVEMYSDGDTNSPDYYSEIWIAVKEL
jgi:AraC family transcriptional regulator